MGVQYVSMCQNYTQPTSGGSTALVGCPVAHLLIQRFLQLRLYPFIFLEYQYPYAPWCWHIYLQNWVIFRGRAHVGIHIPWSIWESWTCHNVVFPWFDRWVPPSPWISMFPTGFQPSFPENDALFLWHFLKHSQQKKQCHVYIHIIHVDFLIYIYKHI